MIQNESRYGVMVDMAVMVGTAIVVVAIIIAVGHDGSVTRENMIRTHNDCVPEMGKPVGELSVKCYKYLIKGVYHQYQYE